MIINKIDIVIMPISTATDISIQMPLSSNPNGAGIESKWHWHRMMTCIVSFVPTLFKNQNT